MENNREVQQIAAQILSGLLSNPHIYASVSDEGAKGTQEQELMLMAIGMARDLVATVNKLETP